MVLISSDGEASAVMRHHATHSAQQAFTPYLIATESLLLLKLREGLGSARFGHGVGDPVTSMQRV